VCVCLSQKIDRTCVQKSSALDASASQKLMDLLQEWMVLVREGMEGMKDELNAERMITPVTFMKVEWSS
jgi:hypothetical protein